MSIMNVLGVKTTGHVKRSRGVNESELIKQHEGNLHNIRKVLSMQCLTSFESIINHMCSTDPSVLRSNYEANFIM